MRKLGIYLESTPKCGGTYQYNKVILDALCELPGSYEINVIYADKYWQNILAVKNCNLKYVAPSKFWQYAIAVLRRFKLPMDKLRAIVAKYHPLAKAMLELDCDFWFFPSQDSYAYLMPVKSIATIHDLMHRYEGRFAEVGAENEYNWREFHYKNTCQFSSVVLVDSELGKKQVIDSYQIEFKKCKVLPYIAPADLMLTAHQDVTHFSIPSKYIFYPAQFWQHKNHKNLLLALNKIKAKIPDIHLVLVGSQKNAYQDVMQLITTLDLTKNVTCLGLVADKDMAGFYKNARALVMPTYFGPTNIPPLEAFALGCPVAISGIYAMKNQLGKAALYFDPDKVDDIAMVIEQLWTDDELCQKLIAAGKSKHELWRFPQFCQRVTTIMDDVYRHLG